MDLGDRQWEIPLCLLLLLLSLLEDSHFLLPFPRHLHSQQILDTVAGQGQIPGWSDQRSKRETGILPLQSSIKDLFLGCCGPRVMLMLPLISIFPVQFQV